MKVSLITLLLPLIFVSSLSAQCDDGLLNNTEYFEDCGGLFCDEFCSIGANIPTIQRNWYHKQISFVDPFFTIGNIAVSDNGGQMVWSYWDINSGDVRVYSKSPNTDDQTYLIHERQPGDGTLSTAYVDISDDGSSILFSYGSKIYVCDLDGRNKIMVLEEVSNTFGDWDLSLKSPPQFAPGNEPEDLYFVQVEFGGLDGTGAQTAGLWRTKTNQKTTGQQIFSALDIAKLYGEDEFSYTAKDGVFGPLVTNNNDILFGTRDYSTSGYSDLWLYESGNFTEITKKGPPGSTFSASFTQMDISSDGSTICWMDGEDHSYNAINRFTGVTNKFKNLGLGNDDVAFNFTGSMRTNKDGTLFFLHGSSNQNYNTALVTNTGKVHYPLALSKFSFAPTHGVNYITMQKKSGDMVYYSSKVGNIWKSEFEKYILQNSHPEIIPLKINHTLKEHFNGPPYGEMSVFAAVDNPNAPPVEYVTFMELDDSVIPKNHLNNAPSSELFDDGTTNGDESIDNIFSSNYIWPTFEEYNSEEEDTISLRIIAGNDTYISSVDIYPYYILDQPITTSTIDENTKSSFNIFPSVAQTDIWVDFLNLNQSKVKSIYISNQIGEFVKQVPIRSDNSEKLKININDINSGIHFLSIETHNELITQKFIKL